MPAVAAIRMRLVLFILNRFKGYLDGLCHLEQVTCRLEFYVRRLNCEEESCNSVKPTVRLTAKAASYVKTDVEGRRHCVTKRIRDPCSLCRK